MERPGEGHGHGVVREDKPGIRERLRALIARFGEKGPYGLVELANFLGALSVLFALRFPAVLIATIVFVSGMWIWAPIWACFNMWNAKSNAPPPPNPLKGA